MFKYYITAYVKNEGVYYVSTEKVTKITVYAFNAQEAEQKARSILSGKNRYSSKWVWIIRIDKIEELLEGYHEVTKK